MPFTQTFKKTFISGKLAKEEVIKDDGVYRMEFARDKKIQTFNKACKTLQYGNGELFTALPKTLEDTHKDVWNNLVEKTYRHDSANTPGKQTTAAFKEALKRYQEGITNQVRLCDVQI